MPQCFHRSVLFACILAAFVLIGPRMALPAIRDAIPIVLTGQQAPGLPHGTVFSSVQDIEVASDGSLVLSAGLLGEGIDNANNSGVWTGKVGSLQLLAREGEAPPNLEGGDSFHWFNNVLMNDAGQIALLAQLKGENVDDGNDFGIWFGTSEGLGLVVRDGQQASGIAGQALYEQVGDVRLNQKGDLAFVGQVAGAGITEENRIGIWTGRPEDLQLTARFGDHAPGTPEGVRFNFSFEYEFNDSSDVLLRARLAGPNVDHSNSRGIWSGAAETLELAIRKGNPTPLAGTVYDDFSYSPPAFNDNGTFAFLSELAGDGVDESNDYALWIGDDHGVRVLVQQGTQLPGLPDGIEFFAPQVPVIHNRGQLVMTATVDGPGVSRANDLVLLTGQPGDLRVVLREGDDAPDMAAGTFFQSIRSLISNEHGYIAFSATLSGPDIDPRFDDSLWLMDPDGNLQILVQENDYLNLNGIYKRVITLQTPQRFSDGGHLIYDAVFDDSSFGTMVVIVPEPGTFAIALLGAIAWAVTFSSRQYFRRNRAIAS